MERKVKILFVDDEVRIVKLLRVMFRAHYDVYTATSGAEAIGLLEANPVDIIVSDQRMPGMVGIELLAQVRQRWPNTIRLLLTGYSDLVAIIGAVNEGEVYRFLNKPWNHADLKATIDECATIARETDKVLAVSDMPSVPTSPLASSVKLLTLDGLSGDRHEVVEMFTKDYDLVSATNAEQARTFIRDQSVGVIIVSESFGPPDELVTMLREFKESSPPLTIVLLSGGADSQRIIQLINQAHIYRFAMKPISPNVFRLAVAAAVREHHRLLADLRLRGMAGTKAEPEMATAIVDSLSRFTPMTRADSALS